MKKYWIALLLAIAATQAIAGEKEYTYRICDESTILQSCDKCKELENTKISYEVKTEQKKVMQIFTGADGKWWKADIIYNCEINDKNNIYCETKKSVTKNNFDDLVTESTFRLDVGQWEIVNSNYEINLKGVESKYKMTCGYEIKKGFNFFEDYKIGDYEINIAIAVAIAILIIGIIIEYFMVVITLLAIGGLIWLLFTNLIAFLLVLIIIILLSQK
jgi:hypothetical protein